jgi:hypothetical protein
MDRDEKDRDEANWDKPKIDLPKDRNLTDPAIRDLIEKEEITQKNLDR